MYEQQHPNATKIVNTLKHGMASKTHPIRSFKPSIVNRVNPELSKLVVTMVVKMKTAMKLTFIVSVI